MEEENYEYLAKVTLIGDSGVGKTNIMSNYLDNKFIKDSKPTVGVEFYIKTFKLEGHLFKIQFWDAGGQQRYRSIISSYLKGCKGAIVVYDITNRNSFDKVDYWIKNLKDLSGEDSHIVIMGNKCDLKSQRKISKEQGEEEAKKFKADFIETSAFSGENLDKAFEKLMNGIYQKNFKEYKDNNVPSNNEVKEKNESEEDNKEFLKNENEKLKEDLNYYKTEYEKLKKEYDKLKNENDKLNNELNKTNKIISNYYNESKENTNLNEIIKLKNIILNKDNEILDLKLKLQRDNNAKKSVNYDDILFIHFISPDQRINCPIKCLKTETFAEVEEKLYQKYEEYRETNNNFLAKGNLVLRFKKICENNIKDGDKVQLMKIE